MASAAVTTAQSSMADMLIEARRLYRHDPLLVLLKDRWRLSYRWILPGSVVLPAIIFGLWELWLHSVPTSARSFWTNGSTISELLQIGLLFPLLFLIYFHLPAWLASIFNQMYTRQIIGTPRKSVLGTLTYQRFVALFTLWMDTWWWSLGALALVVVYLCFRIPLVEVPASVAQHGPLWLRCCDLLAFAPLMYATFLCIVRVVGAFVAINLLFWTFTIHIRPAHPDGSGGLGVVRRLIWLSVAMLLWDALLLLTGELASSVSIFQGGEKFLLGLIYLVLVPLVFVGWLLLPHQVMVRERDQLLQPLADEMYQLVEQARERAHEETAMMKETTDRLLELQRRHEFICATFPTWPLEIRSLGRLALVLIVPPLIPIILPWLLSFVGQLWLLFGHLSPSP